MRRLIKVCAISLAVTSNLVPIATHAGTECTQGPGTFIRTKLVTESGAPSAPPRDVALLLLPGGTAEYSVGDICNTLTFTAIHYGHAVYTDDGLGRGLTVVVTKDRKLIVSHVAGWMARSQ